ncbi:hypothetical protein PAXRUDRAFT_823374 [Paxillus rubicundulus Ve08.2h10]|uniref:Uncharacterized protein n=1 Tax=Paxillus rubicundulus Ve08.2h10 TaxID=930991 RepID=A0A0D0E3R9_9AGAM|nr:hypothetical protein PAXRUDRAFT_823374 [Paxillus rubicundulus Ve08.2h10]
MEIQVALGWLHLWEQRQNVDEVDGNSWRLWWTDAPNGDYARWVKSCFVYDARDPAGGRKGINSSTNL